MARRRAPRRAQAEAIAAAQAARMAAAHKAGTAAKQSALDRVLAALHHDGAAGRRGASADRAAMAEMMPTPQIETYLAHRRSKRAKALAPTQKQ